MYVFFEWIFVAVVVLHIVGSLDSRTYSFFLLLAVENEC